MWRSDARPGQWRRRRSAAERREVQASQEISNALNELIIDATARFRPLDYEYDEDLLKIVDRVEAYLSGKTPAPPSRVLPKLDVQEEMDHFRETFRRWKARTGKDLRVEIDRLRPSRPRRQAGRTGF